VQSLAAGGLDPGRDPEVVQHVEHHERDLHGGV
jgi:hypothetical protein